MADKKYTQFTSSLIPLNLPTDLFFDFVCFKKGTSCVWFGISKQETSWNQGLLFCQAHGLSMAKFLDQEEFCRAMQLFNYHIPIQSGMKFYQDSIHRSQWIKHEPILLIAAHSPTLSNFFNINTIEFNWIDGTRGFSNFSSAWDQRWYETTRGEKRAYFPETPNQTIADCQAHLKKKEADMNVTCDDVIQTYIVIFCDVMTFLFCFGFFVNSLKGYPVSFLLLCVWSFGYYKLKQAGYLESPLEKVNGRTQKKVKNELEADIKKTLPASDLRSLLSINGQKNKVAINQSGKFMNVFENGGDWIRIETSRTGKNQGTITAQMQRDKIQETKINNTREDGFVCCELRLDNFNYDEWVKNLSQPVLPSKPSLNESDLPPPPEY